MLQKKPAPLRYARADEDAIIDAINGQHRNVQEASYGARGDDTGNDAPAIQAAINDTPSPGGIVYLPPGTYRLASSIIFPNDRQIRLIGAGRTITNLHVDPNTTASPGVIQLRASELAPSIERLQIYFDQPDTSNRASLVQYVPAIYAQNCGRHHIRHVRIARAWDAIDWRGNTGGSSLHDVEISSFHRALQLDGTADASYVTQLHVWPFYLSGNQFLATYDADCIGIHCARADGLHISNSSFLTGQAMFFYNSANGPPWVMMSNVTFDGVRGLRVQGGRISIASCSIGHTDANARGVFVQDGALEIAGSHLQMSGAATNPCIEVSGGYLTMTGMKIQGFNIDQTQLKVSGGTATVTGCLFLRDGNLPYSNPTVSVTSGRLTFSGNRTSDKGGGLATFVSITTDENHAVTDNIFVGWQLALPVAHTFPVYGNFGALNATTARELLVVSGFVQAAGDEALIPSAHPPVAWRRYTGTLNVSGEALVPHGLTDLPRAALIAGAWNKGPSGEAGPITIGFVDATNIFVTGGLANAPFRVTIGYTNIKHLW